MSLSVSMTAKRAKLASEINTILDAHTTFTVVERLRKVVSEGQIDAKAVMGSPIAYCRIAHAGNLRESEEHMQAFGSVAQVPHLFAVLLWLQYADADTYAASSQKTWDDLLEADGENPGILTYLRDVGGFETEDGVIYVSPPIEVLSPPEPLNMYENIFAHYCQFFITLT